MTAGHLLLVSPAFHGYWRSIADAFTRRGYAVHTHLVDAESAWGKVRHKLGHELPERVGRDALARDRATERAVRRLQEVHPDQLLVIKGDTLGDAFWDEVASVSRRALWLYDELRRTDHTSASLAAAGPIASYSPLDVEALRAQGLEAIHVPLAHDPHLAHDRRSSDEVVFVGARYPNRERLLLELHRSGVPVSAYGRDWSTHPFDRLRTWRWRSPAIPAGRDLTRSEAYAVMAGARATLNVHGDQDGFTMRTFEAAGVGALELIDRADVGALYEPGVEVAVFADTDEAVELCERAKRDPRWSQALRRAGERRTLDEHTFDHRATSLEALWA